MKIVWYTEKQGRVYVDNILVGYAYKGKNGNVEIR